MFNKNKLFQSILYTHSVSENTAEEFRVRYAKYYRETNNAYALIRYISRYSNKHLKFRIIFILKNSDASTQNEFHNNAFINLAGNKVPLRNARRLLFLRPFNLSIYLTSLSFNYKRAAGKKINYLIGIQFGDSNTESIYIKTSILWRMTRYWNAGSKIGKIINPNKNLSVFLRQSKHGYLSIMFRNRNTTDSMSERLKLNFAWLMSLPLRFLWRPILLYEKELSKFEESGAIVFEELKKRKYKSIYFLFSLKNELYQTIKQKHGKSIIDKFSFKHYLAFYCAKSFIGTETPVYALENRCASSHVMRRIKSESLKFVFLQHGVMYMVSLASKQRRGFRHNGGLYPKNTKIVVSSKEEAIHFMDEGEYPAQKIYLTGVPKFDFAESDKSADKIVIMPTWRPWEFNKVRLRPEKTGYYAMLKTIVESIPEDLKNKVVVLPHPLFRDAFQKTELSNYLSGENGYDEILKKTRLLITDYSSISYDAFYRGANVVFWWKDKDYCMEQYGGSLKLNKSNTFGDIVFDIKSLASAVNNNYSNPQNKEHSNNYKRLVEFSDNKNTERLINKLVEDDII